MKNNGNFFRVFALLCSIFPFSIRPESSEALSAAMTELHTKIYKLHEGFALIFFEGNKNGHLQLEKLQPIKLVANPTSSIAKKINSLVGYLNPKFASVQKVIVKFKGKGKGVAILLLTELAKCCTLTEIFGVALEHLNGIFQESLDANDFVCAQKAKELMQRIIQIQEEWKNKNKYKETMFRNLQNSL
jgi:hypothetical protein